MGKPTGFLEIKRQNAGYRPVEERLSDYREVEQRLPEELRMAQASRCMDCGVPFCHWACPLGNVMPEWQEALQVGNWQQAINIIQSTNNFPEFTGRVCPALCEASCVLSIGDDAVAIRENELAVIEYGFEKGYIKPRPPQSRTGKKVVVIGSGPAGLACADQLNKAGHNVDIFEQDESPGGLLRLGIPDFKLDKRIIDRRVKMLEKEGINFHNKTKVGQDISLDKLIKEYDAICLAVGARDARDLSVPGRATQGIYFAMDYLSQQNRINSGVAELSPSLSAQGKNVLVIGGGDTGSDCVGIANRQGANSITQIEILPKPPEDRDESRPWPMWPTLLKTSSSHQEGCERLWSVATKEFKSNEKGQVQGIKAVKVDWQKPAGNNRPVMKEIPGSDFEINADLVLLALGFTNPEIQPSQDKVFVAGDARRGASLVVWAIEEGRQAAAQINQFLT